MSYYVLILKLTETVEILHQIKSTQFCVYCLADWSSGEIVGRINEVTLH